jgi:hypothetical protein
MLWLVIGDEECKFNKQLCVVEQGNDQFVM